MRMFGWCLFGVGALFIIIGGFVGMESGFGRVTNIAGLVVGTALLVSGAIFISSSDAIEASNELKRQLVQTRDENRLMFGFPLDTIPEIQEMQSVEKASPMEGILPYDPKSTAGSAFVFMEETYATEEEAKVARQEFIEKYGRT